MIKKLKIQKVSRDWSLMVVQKVRKQGIGFCNERTFWHEMIYKSLFWLTSVYIGLPKVGIKLL